MFLKIDFIEFNTEQDNDVVTVYAGVNEYGRVQARLSGVLDRKTVLVRSSEAYVTFTSDGDLQLSGFKAHVALETPPPTPTAGPTRVDLCGGITTVTPPGTIASNRVGTYTSGMTCGWIISANNGTVIVLKFTKVDTEKDWDYVVVYEGGGPTGSVVGKMSGTLPGETVVTAWSSMAFVQFTSDGLNQGTGFTALVTAVDPALQGLSPPSSSTNSASKGDTAKGIGKGSVP